MSCAQSSDPNGLYDLELYSLADGTRQAVTPHPGLPQCAVPEFSDSECAKPDAVGADWIRWDASCYHCADTYLFQNIHTGNLRGDPANATTFTDLDSPALAHRTCSGVRLMHESLPNVPPWGPLTPYGQFALVIGGTGQIYPAVFLERCGTHMRRLLASPNPEVGDPPLASNSRMIVWRAVPGRLTGLFLPSLQTFTIPLPSAIVNSGSPNDNPVPALGLTSRALYVNGAQALWRTVSPTALPPNTNRPTLTRFRKHRDLQTWKLAQRGPLLLRVAGERQPQERRHQTQADSGQRPQATQRELQRDRIQRRGHDDRLERTAARALNNCAVTPCVVTTANDAGAACST